MTYLIIGGTAGLGASLAQKLAGTNEVHVTGRHDPSLKDVMYHMFPITSETSVTDMQNLLKQVGHVDSLIYSPGYFQEGTVTDLNEAEIYTMLEVGVTAAIQLTRQILLDQSGLPEFVAITSTSQYTPRKLEPIYTTVKAGLGAYANSLSLDERVKKTLVAGPAGMKTKFHANHDVDMSTYLDPDWVADQVLAALAEDFTYKYIRILRDPAHVEIQETR